LTTIFNYTLSYSNGNAVYIPEDDSTCYISFHFKKNGIDVTQSQDNLNFGCGFGHAVFADGYYKRISKRVPEIIDLLTEVATTAANDTQTAHNMVLR
jgi:hypothetical protein